MANQIIMQPNGKFAVWSSAVDDLIIEDADANDIIEYFVDLAKVDAIRDVQYIINELQLGEKPYFQFTKTWDEVKHKHHG